jgi:gliding motility-associated-like protein
LFRVTASNECGIYTDSTRIYLSSCDSCITVPNAFSPNGDGLNDKFYAIYKCPITNFHITIYNRWGQVVYESRDVKQVWPGTISGQYVEQGVYLYIIDYTPESSGIPNILKGNITVLR